MTLADALARIADLERERDTERQNRIQNLEDAVKERARAEHAEAKVAELEREVARLTAERETDQRVHERRLADLAAERDGYKWNATLATVKRVEDLEREVARLTEKTHAD